MWLQLCDAYIFVKGIITVTGENNGDKKNRFLAFNNNAPRSIMYWLTMQKI